MFILTSEKFPSIIRHKLYISFEDNKLLLGNDMKHTTRYKYGTDYTADKNSQAKQTHGPVTSAFSEVSVRPLSGSSEHIGKNVENKCVRINRKRR